jgi:anti-sigma B factor antagonist
MDEQPMVRVDEAGRAALSGEFTIAYAAALHEQLRDAVAAGRLHFDLSAVSECDSAGVQLLLSAHRSAQAQGGQLLLAQASVAVQSSLQRYGLTHLLQA